MTFAGAMKAAAIFFVGPLVLFIAVVLAIALVQKRLGISSDSRHNALATDNQLLRGEGMQRTYSGASAAPPACCLQASSYPWPQHLALMC